MYSTVSPLRTVSPESVEPIAYIKADVITTNKTIIIDRLWVIDDLEGTEALMPVRTMERLDAAEFCQSMSHQWFQYFQWCDGLGRLLAQS